MAALPAAEPFASARVVDVDASFFDVQARRAQFARKPLESDRAVSPGPAKCAVTLQPTPPTGPMEIPRRYLVPPPGHGPVNPEQAKRAAPYWGLEDYVARASSRYVARGDVEAARCMIEVLDEWAQARAMLTYDPVAWPQSWYTVEWTASAAALAVSVVRGEPSLDRAALARVISWLDRVARRQLSHAVGELAAANNHAHWRGLMATATGIIAGDDELFRRGLKLYASAISNLAEDGSWPAEMRRRELSLHYQNFAIQPLVSIAELAARQGIDLYGYQGGGRSLADAVEFLLRAIDDESVIRRYQPMKQDAIKASDFAWMVFWQHRHPDARVARHLNEPLFNPRLGGDISAFVGD